MIDDRTQPVYILDDHRTLEWMNRTQAINRMPAMRGGIAVDHQTRRQTAAGLGVVLLVLLILLLLPWPSGKATIAAPVRAIAPQITEVSRKPSPVPALPPVTARPPVRWASVQIIRHGGNLL